MSFCDSSLTCVCWLDCSCWPSCCSCIQCSGPCCEKTLLGKLYIAKHLPKVRVWKHVVGDRDVRFYIPFRLIFVGCQNVSSFSFSLLVSSFLFLVLFLFVTRSCRLRQSSTIQYQVGGTSTSLSRWSSSISKTVPNLHLKRKNVGDGWQEWHYKRAMVDSRSDTKELRSIQ